MAAGAKYLQSRRNQVAARREQEQRKKLEQEIKDQAIQSANAFLNTLFQQGNKVAACKEIMPLVQSNGMDVSDKDPLFLQLESLRKWAERAR